MTEELKPCPWCESLGLLYNDGDKLWPWMVEFRHKISCPMSGVSLQFARGYETKSEAIAAWNTRPSTPPAVSDDLVEEITYLVKLADWCAGQGFCQIDGLEEPEEWCFRMWPELGAKESDHYSADALAQLFVAAIHRREQQAAEAMLPKLTRPIVGIENRTAREVFDIMCGRFRALPIIEHRGEG